ncbi:MAG: hypothetical protein JEY94_00320 [Melioribacteraceae bacterium]|nr:hypothetical protein [Melioribacteraceae bacterium]
MKKLSMYIVLLLTLLNFINAQELSVGTDVVSRYVWRGLDFGNSPSVQPGISYSNGGFEAGTWGAFTTDSQASGVDELDLYASYSFSLGKSNLSLVVTDYYFPNAGVKLGNFNNYDDESGAGAHIFEVGASFTLSEAFPLSISAYSNVYNDEDNSMYFEVGYSTSVKDVSLDLFAGGTTGGDNEFYGTADLNIINVGLTVSKEIKITESFSLPVFGSYIINPNLEISYLVLGISL